MTFPRIDGKRAMEIGTPGPMRQRLNGLILDGLKEATAGLATDYEAEGEAPEHVGEHLMLVDDVGVPIAELVVTEVEQCRFDEVPWAFAEAECEGDESIEEWREGHRAFWESEGIPITDATEVVLVYFSLLED